MQNASLAFFHPAPGVDVSEAEGNVQAGEPALLHFVVWDGEETGEEEEGRKASPLARSRLRSPSSAILRRISYSQQEQGSRTWGRRGGVCVFLLPRDGGTAAALSAGLTILTTALGSLCQPKPPHRIVVKSPFFLETSGESVRKGPIFQRRRLRCFPQPLPVLSGDSWGLGDGGRTGRVALLRGAQANK